MGLERLLAGHTRKVAAYLGSTCHRGNRPEELPRRPFAGYALLPEPDLVRRWLLHHQLRAIPLDCDCPRFELRHLRRSQEEEPPAFHRGFPQAEAATKDEFAKRIQYYGNHFWLLMYENQIVSFVDGFVTNQKDLSDEMYEKASLHDEAGQWQMIFGVNTLPSYRKKGYAAKLLERVIDDAQSQNRKGIVLTCKDALVPYYTKFGFTDEGISEKSVHGGVRWHQMRLTF